MVVRREHNLTLEAMRKFEVIEKGKNVNKKGKKIQTES